MCYLFTAENFLVKASKFLAERTLEKKFVDKVYEDFS